MTTQIYHQLFNLKGKTAIVTGGLGILGRRFCAGLAEFGANVAVVDLDETQSGSYASELTSRFGVDSLGVACDISDEDSVIRMVSLVVEKLGPIHILLNNAASKSEDLRAFFASFETYTLSEWRRVMSVNLDGMFLVAKAVGSQMISQGTGGSVIQTSSIYGIMSPDERIYEGSNYLNTTINTPAVYSVSKAAVVGLSRYLATHWAQYGIRVNTLTPGGVESGQNETFKNKYSNRTPIGRMAKPDELVGAIIYLASDASSYVTGHNLIVDGGLHAW